MRLKRHVILLYAFFYVIGTHAHDTTSVQELEEVLIHGTRSEPLHAVGTHIIDADTLARMLQSVPGVQTRGSGGVSDMPSVRGLTDDRLRIKVDGMDLIASCPNHMNPALSYLDPSQLDILYVYAGIAPVSMGDDSIGATIVAETIAPQFAEPGQAPLLHGEVGAFYRSNGNAKTGTVSATWASTNASLSYTGASSQAEDYRAGGAFKTTHDTGRPGHSLALDKVGSSAWRTRNHALSLALKNEHHLIQASLGYQDMPYQLYPNQRMDLLNNEQKRVNVRYLGHFEHIAIEARIYREHVDHSMDFGTDRRFWYGSNSDIGIPCAPIRFVGDPNGTCAAGMPMRTSV